MSDSKWYHVTSVRCLAWFFGLLVGFAAGPLNAATYAYRADTFAYDTPTVTAANATWHSTNASPACTAYPLGDDDWADIAFPSGFTFTFGGVAYSSVRAYSNGMLAFPPDVSGFHRNYTPQALPITAGPGAYTGCVNAVPQNLMIAYWVDIIAGTATGITNANVKSELLTDGVTGQKRFVVTWNNVALYGNSATRYSFQIALFESSAGVNGNFRYQYTTGSTTGLGATVGVQLTTADYTQYAYNQNFIDTAVGTAVLWYPANQLAGKSAEYRFDEGAWTGVAGEIKDTSGSLQNASRLGASANVAGGKLCRGATFTNNTSNSTIDAVATPIVPASLGSVDFWYKSNTAWNAASSDAMLLDASTVAARPFFLMKRATGALRFVATDSAGVVLTAETSSAYTYAANTWHHIAVSWSLKPGTNQTVMQIMLDGALVTTGSSTPFRTTSSGTIATLSTLYIGDNRTSGITPNTGSPNGANGTIDEVYVYAIDINATQAAADMALTRPVCTSLDHFHIIHGGSLVNCGSAVASITIEAHDVNHALFSLAGTTVNLSTSTAHGTWSNVASGSINSVNNLGNGAATYTFAGETSITLGLSNTFIESLNINLVSGTVTENSGAAATCSASDYTFGTTCDANLSFDGAGFRFVDTSGSNISNQVAGTASGTYFLQAVKSSCATPGSCAGVCTALFPAGTAVSIDLASECVNPTACKAGQAVTFTPGASAGTAGLIAANASGAVSASAGTYTAKSLTFNAVTPNPTPAVPFTLNYSDVGKIRLWARYTGGSSTISGSSASFVSAPAKFAIGAVTGPIKAGINFSTTVTAQNSAGATTPNFGNETTAETATLAFTKCQPTGTGASNGTFGGAGAITLTNGVANLSNLNWSEAGNGDLTASLTGANYLGSGLTATGNTGTSSTVCNTGAAPKSGNVGAFVPDHFDTVVTQGCSAGSFTYSGQPFTVQIKAMNGAATPVITQNYDGTATTSPNFARAVTLSDASATSGGALAGSGVVAASFSAGVSTTSAPVFGFTSAKTLPATIKIRAVDSDGVSSLRAVAASSVEGTTEIRSGRVQLQNAYGSEYLALPVPVVLQYWNGSWQKNTVDTCTSILGSQFTWAFPAGTAPRLNNLAACESAVTVSGTAPSYTVKLGAPGAGNAGWADLALNLGAAATGSACTTVNAGTGYSGVATTANAPWLQYNWTGTVGNPSARATFGVYKNPLIYRRENY